MSIVARLQEVLRDHRTPYSAVGLVAAVAAFFRLDWQSLWLDEAISIAWAARKPIAWIWENVPKYDLHPPLYYSVLHFWQAIFGDSVFFIRSLSAFFFVGSSILLYHFALVLFKSPKNALFAALIFATNPFAVLYAQETRSYSMLIFFIILNSYFFYKLAFLQSSRRLELVVYWLTALVLIYTNILALFALFAHFIIVLFLRNKTLLKKFFLIYFSLFIVYLPALRTIRSANNFDYSYYYTEKFGALMQAVVALAGFIGARINVLNGKRHVYPLLAASLALYGALFGIGIRKIKEMNRFILYFFLISFISILTATYIKFPVPDPKYFYVAFPFFILASANLLMLIDNKIIQNLFFSALLIFNFVFLYNYYFVKSYERENWKAVVGAVEADFMAEKNKSGFVLSPAMESYAPWQYYSHSSIAADGAMKYGDATTSIERAVNELVGKTTDIVYLSRFLQPMYDPQDKVNFVLVNDGYKKTKVFSDTKVEYWRYDKIVNK